MVWRPRLALQQLNLEYQLDFSFARDRAEIFTLISVNEEDAAEAGDVVGVGGGESGGGPLAEAAVGFGAIPAVEVEAPFGTGFGGFGGGEGFEGGEGDGEFEGPAGIAIGGDVEGTGEGGSEADAGELELGEEAAAGEHEVIVEGAAGVHFEADVGGGLGGVGVQEDFDGIVFVSGIIAPDVSGGNVGIYAFVGDVEVGIVPEEAGAGGLGGAGLGGPGEDEVDGGGAAPGGFVETAIDGEGGGSAMDVVTGEGGGSGLLGEEEESEDGGHGRCCPGRYCSGAWVSSRAARAAAMEGKRPQAVS